MSGEFTSGYLQEVTGENIMKKISLAIVIMACTLMTGCQLNSAPEKIGENNLIYFRDSRTGLCFAAINTQGYGGYQATSITNVPCDAVKDVLKQ